MTRDVARADGGAPSAASPLDALPPAVRAQIAGIVERVFLSGAGDPPRIVAFAGIDADARSGWITAAVADVLARRTPASVAVVDMNFAKPGLHEYFTLNGMEARGDGPAPGAEVSIVDEARRVGGNLWIVPSTVLAGVNGFTAACRPHITRLTRVFDHVIVNLEPLTAWFGGGLPTMADGIVLVVAADVSRREIGRQVAERLQASGGVILGAVLTNRHYAIPKALYKRL